MDKFKSSIAKRFRNSNRRTAFAKRQGTLAPDVGVNSVCDYDQMRSCRTPDGEYARSECGNTTTRFRKECPVYLAKMKMYKGNGKCQGNGKENFSDIKGEGNINAVGGKDKGSGETRNSNVRIGEVQNDTP